VINLFQKGTPTGGKPKQMEEKGVNLALDARRPRPDPRSNEHDR
jgi:hypothetical protein